MEKSKWNFGQRISNLWEEALTDLQQRKIKMIVDNPNFIIFFKHKNELYGASEDARVTFARMKDVDDEDGPGWLKDASVNCTNLVSLGKGEQIQTVFTYADLRDLMVVDKEEVAEDLQRYFEREKNKK